MTTSTTQPMLREIADGVHAFLQPDGSWCLNNAGVIVTGGRTTLVDTAATKARALRLRTLVGELGAPVPTIVINTHSHGDHSFGNCVFPEAVVVADDRTRGEAAAIGLHLTGLWPEVEWGELELVLPHLTFTDRMTLRLTDDLTVELHSFGPAHTVRDAVAWLPERRALFAGDLVMSGVTPFVMMGSPSGLREAIARLRTFDATTIVPGHGPVGGPELLEATERYLDWLTDLARRGLEAGADPLEVARQADLGEFAELLDHERLVPNLHRAYHETRGELNPPPSIETMFESMVRYHGGVPRCHA